MKLSELIQSYLDNQNISYREFCSRSDISPGYISMIVNEYNPRTGKPPVPTIQKYAQIAKSMRMTMDELFRSIDDTPVSMSEREPTIVPNPLSEEETELILAYRAADERARSDAMTTLLSHPANVGKNRA